MQTRSRSESKRRTTLYCTVTRYRVRGRCGRTVQQPSEVVRLVRNSVFRAAAPNNDIFTELSGRARATAKHTLMPLLRKSPAPRARPDIWTLYCTVL